jgi:hypothetical protein
MLRFNFTNSWIIRILFLVRGLPKKTVFGLDQIEKMGFRVLRMNEDEEIILGLIGQFWKPSGEIKNFEPSEFYSFNDPELVKATWNFRIVGSKPPFILETETRIFCPGESSRKKFSRYWFVIKPFSGIIRMEMLKSIRKDAER